MIHEIEVKQMLSEAGIPVYRGHAPVGTAVPYIVYTVNYGNNFGADNITYMKVPSYRVELYDIAPNLSTRELIENKLTEEGVKFVSDEADQEDEQLYLTIYTFGGLN